MKNYTLFKALFSALMIFSTSILYSQNTYELLLKSEKFVPEKGISASVLEYSSHDVVNGKLYRLIQFNETPSKSQKETIAARGVELLSYIPHRAYFAAIPKDISISALEQLNIRTILPITAEMKTDPLLKELPLPGWALLEKNKIDVIISLFENLDLPKDLNALQNDNILILKQNNYTKSVTIRIPVQDIEKIASLPFVQYIEPISPPGEPENYGAHTLHRSNVINGSFPGSRKYDGTGVTVAMFDDGFIGPHIDYQGRIVDQYVLGTNLGDHGDHVSGTIMGAGNLDPEAQGMAPGADLVVYRAASVYNGFDSIYNHYFTKNIVITSTSYSNGCNAGYTSFTREMDLQIGMMPSLVHVFSAGNDGSSNCGYGAGSGWGNITGGHKQAKNVITVGNVSNTDFLQSSSSRGPASDGRVKPDVCAKGTSVYSTVDPNDYEPKTGTSMSCPGVSGSLAQLYHAYKDQNNGVTPPSALIKAIMLNTADDLGNPGPDFKFGWGRVNNLKAVEAIEGSTYFSGIMDHSDSATHTIAVPAGVKELKIMVYWPDTAASLVSAIALVNDLNMTVSDPSNNVNLPLILDPTPNSVNLNNNAIPGIDFLNNMEQVVLSNPTAGNYTVKVKGFNVPLGPQEYYVVYEMTNDSITLTHPYGGESFEPGEFQTIRWDTYGNANNFTLEYSTNGGTSWNTISSFINGSSRHYTWSVPSNLIATEMIMRISRGAMSDTTDVPVSVIHTPENLEIVYRCPDSVKVKWDAVPGAIAYEASILGQKYMDSAGTTTDTFFVYSGISISNEDWVSVKALGPNGIIGRRALAIYKPAGKENCLLPNDAALGKIVSPSGVIQDCQNTAALAVTVKIVNASTTPLTNIPVSYQLNNGTVVNEIYAGPIAIDSSYLYTFSNTISLSAGISVMKAWVDYPNDTYIANDTVFTEINIISGNTWTPSFTVTFDSENGCSTFSNCEATVCNLNNGWINAPNNDADDIDWRVNNSSTPSNNTGPSVDHTLGNAQGKYVYLEASGSPVCSEKTAILISPCIDLSSTKVQELSFWYHMFGGDMGSLYVDIFANNIWIENVWSKTGNQGNFWQEAVINLSAYSGQTINIRFRGVTGDDYESDIALDDISVRFNPSAGINAPTSACEGNNITFASSSSGTNLSYVWDFGSGATPATATTAGPHVVSYSSPGSKTVMLVVSNSNGSDTTYTTINVLPAAEADFSYIINNMTVDFNNLSLNGIFYNWNFGDGVISSDFDPSHTYSTPGIYTVTLTSTNTCSSDIFSQEITVGNVGINDTENEALTVNIYPNPASEMVNIEIGNINSDIQIEMMDVQGKNILNKEFSGRKDFTTQLDLKNLAKGVYYLKIKSDNETRIEKLTIQ